MLRMKRFASTEGKMDEAALEPNINPALRKINERNRAFWDRRNAVDAKLLSNPEIALYVIENLRTAEFRDALLREIQRDAATASSVLEEASAELGKASADLAKASSELQRIYDGASKREDQLDKQ